MCRTLNNKKESQGFLWIYSFFWTKLKISSEAQNKTPSVSQYFIFDKFKPIFFRWIKLYLTLLLFYAYLFYIKKLNLS